MSDYCPPNPTTILPVYNPENWIETCQGTGGGGGIGPQGPQGILGISGVQGIQGPGGSAGGSGLQGHIGRQGSQGATSPLSSNILFQSQTQITVINTNVQTNLFDVALVPTSNGIYDIFAYGGCVSTTSDTTVTLRMYSGNVLVNTIQLLTFGTGGGTNPRDWVLHYKRIQNGTQVSCVGTLNVSNGIFDSTNVQTQRQRLSEGYSQCFYGSQTAPSNGERLTIQLVASTLISWDIKGFFIQQIQ